VSDNPAQFPWIKEQVLPDVREGCVWEKGAGEEEGKKEGAEDVIVVCPKGPSAGQVMRQKKRGGERERERKI